MSDSRHPYVEACINGARSPDEHILLLPDGSITPGNAEPVAAATEIPGTLRWL